VVGGNVETSQRVTDVILGALGMAAASQGTMNNLTFGDSTFGYYETICGGAGAGPGFDGADAVHTHMTNTRLTDPEVMEARFPVRVARFEIRRGSGGEGRWRGGAGCRRELEYHAPVRAGRRRGRRGGPQRALPLRRKRRQRRRRRRHLRGRAGGSAGDRDAGRRRLGKPGLEPVQLGTVRVCQRQELVAAVAATEEGAPDQESKVLPLQSQRAQLGDDAGRFVRDPHHSAASRLFDQSIGERAPPFASDVAEHGGVEDDEGRLWWRLGEQPRQVGHQISPAHLHRARSIQLDRGGESLPPLGVISPDARQQPPRCRRVAEVDRGEVEPGAPHDFRKGAR
jgi:Hydantoinase B/oxoprolinase